MIWLIASLALSACARDTFCVVVPGPKEFAAETAQAMVATDRADVEQIATENEYGARHCGWPKQGD